MSVSKKIINPRVMIVHSLSELANAKFGSANLINFPRKLKGDFNSLAETLGKFLFAQTTSRHQYFHKQDGKNIGSFTREGLEQWKLPLTDDEQIAVDEILADMNFANQNNLGGITLRVIGRNGYAVSLGDALKHRFAEVTGKYDWLNSSDVRKFHTDMDPDFAERDDVSAERLERAGMGCCYNGPVTQTLRNEDARHLDYIYFQKKFGAPVLEDIKPGDLFRRADYLKDRNFLPHIHRAPPGPWFGPPRLLLR